MGGSGAFGVDPFGGAAASAGACGSGAGGSPEVFSMGEGAAWASPMAKPVSMGGGSSTDGQV